MSFENPEGWEEHAIYELATYINGRATKPAEKTPDGIPVIKIAELNRGITASTDRVPTEKVHEKHRIAAGNLLFAWSGTVGIHLYGGPPAALNQHIFKVLAKPPVDQTFLRYLLEGQMRVFERFVADKRTTMGHVTVKNLKETTTAVPPLAEQRRIAGVLSSLDEASEHALHVAGRLQALLQAGFSGLLAESDWPQEPLGDQVEVIMGQSPPGSTYGPASDDGLPLVQGMGVLGPRFPATEVWTSSPMKRAQRGDVLLTVRAPVGEVNICDREYCAGRGVAAIRSAYRAYTEQLVRSLRKSSASQESGTIFPAVNKTQIEAMKVQAPPVRRIEAFEKFARPLYNLIGQQYKQLERLQAVRAELLPKLISGRICVPDSYDPDDVLGALTEQADTEGAVAA